MTRDFVCVNAEHLAAKAVEIMEQKKITALLVIDDNQHLVGALNIHDLFKAGVM